MQKIQRNPNVMWREEEEALARVIEGLDQGDGVDDLGTAVLFCGGTMLSINFLGMEIWKLCDGRSADGITAELLERFDVEEDVLQKDVRSFIDELADKGFISYEN